MNPVVWLFIGGGAFAMLGAVCDWDWFMNNRKARFFVKVFGRNGARVFYALLGLALIVIGMVGVLGIVEMK